MDRRIAIVSPTFPPYRGGIGKVAQLDARQLASAGFDVHVFVPARPDGLPDHEPEYAVHVLRSWARWGNAAFVPGAAGLFRDHDLVLLHYPFFGAAEPMWAWRRLTGKGKLALMYHMDVVGDGALAPLFAAHARWCMPAIVREADRVLVTTEDYAASGMLGKLHAAEPERFRELPPSVDVVRFAPGPRPAELAARHGIKDGEFVVLFVGGLDRAHYFKGVPSLVAAMAAPEMRGARLVVVGSGALRARYEALAARLGIAGRTVFAGGASEEELPSYYRLADVFAFPSVDRSEAFGIAALEALATGVPVVASDLPGVRTIVRHGETGLVMPPGSASALAVRLAALRADAGLRRRLGDAGRRMAVEEYSDERRILRWKAIMHDLLPR
jgi:glycosyltransferase involved in cell wall biosynthesis